MRVRVSGTAHSVTVPPAPYTDTAALYLNYERSADTTTQTHSTGHFSRAISAGMFITSDYQPDDVFPPSRITDLKISANYNTSTVTLSWSAPGDDYDRGSVRSYAVKYAENDAYGLRKRFSSQPSLPLPWITEETYRVLNSPRIAGHVEYLNITLPQRDNVTYYFAVAATDDSGIEGPPSPVVGIALLPPQFPEKPEESSGLNTGIIAAVIVCPLVFVLAGGIVVLVCLKRKQRSRVEGRVDEKAKLHDAEGSSTPGATPSPRTGERRESVVLRRKNCQETKKNDSSLMILAVELQTQRI